MIKKILIGMLAFVFTFVVGTALGIGTLFVMNRGREISFLKWWYKDEVPHENAIDESLFETQTASEAAELSARDASMSANVNLDIYSSSILVLNASSSAGIAGSAAELLKQRGFTTVTAENSSKSYALNSYYAQNRLNASDKTVLEQTLERELSFDETVQNENAAGEYDVVVVLIE